MTDKKHVRRKWDGCFFSWHIIFHLSNAIPLTRLPVTAHPSKFWLGGVEENWERMASGAKSLIGSMRLSVKDGG